MDGHPHGVHADWGSAAVFSIWVVCLGIAVSAYLYGAARERRRGRRWSSWRDASFVAGASLVALAMVGPIAQRGHEDLRWHMIQHLLVGMLAPLGIVLAAPLTLVLRGLPRAGSRTLVSLLKSWPLHVLSDPWSAALFNVGGMYVLYMTPLYAAMGHSALLHQLVHVHFLLAGCLFCWSIAGQDAGATRSPVAKRLLVLFVSTAAHATLGKLMYAYGWPRGTSHELLEIQQAAQWMYYGGDVAEALLAVALFASWPRSSSPFHRYAAPN